MKCKVCKSTGLVNDQLEYCPRCDGWGDTDEADERRSRREEYSPQRIQQVMEQCENELPDPPKPLRMSDYTTP